MSPRAPTEEDEALVAALAGWRAAGADPESARALRARVAAHPGLRLRGPASEGLRALAKVSDIYRNPRRGPAALAGFLEKARDRGAEEQILTLAPLVGDPAMGDWPWNDPLALPEPAAQRWLALLAAVRPPVNDAIRRFLRVMLRLRRRETWLPAARACAALALDDEGLRGLIEDLWRRCFPSWTGPWPKGAGLSTARTELGRDGHHLVRHCLFLGCAWLAAGGAPEVVPGLSLSALLARGLPRDDSDASVVLLGLTEQARADRAVAEQIAAGLKKLLKNLGPRVLCESAARQLADALRGHDLLADDNRLVDQLVKARYRSVRGTAAFDALWAWIETARWLGPGPARQRLRAQAEGAELALSWALADDPEHAPERPVAALIERLAALLDEDRSLTVPRVRRAPLLAEVCLLMERPEVAELPWPPLLRLAGVRLRPEEQVGVFPGSVAEVGVASLAVLLALRGVLSRTLMRTVHLPAPAVLQIGGLQNGFVATQVAIQIERLLRELAHQPQVSQERLRLLWGLLQQDPPARTFLELELVLRSELRLDLGQGDRWQSSPLHAVVAAVGELDRRRDEGAPVEAIAEALGDLVQAAQALLESDESGEPSPILAALPALSRSLARAARDHSSPFDDGWLRRLEEVVLGQRARGGLAGWALWLAGADGEEASTRLRAIERAVRRVSSAVVQLREARPSVQVEHLDEVVAAGAALEDALGSLGWPEERVLEELLARLVATAEEALAEGRRSRAVVQQLHAVLERGDEQALVNLTRVDEIVRLLPPGEVRRSHRFLLGQLRFSDAQALRRAVRGRLSLPSRIQYLVPLYAGVAGGTFLVLDVGEAWLALADGGAWPRYGLTLGLTLVGSLAFLVNSLVAERRGAGGGRLWLVARALPTFAEAGGLALVMSALVMITLGKLAPTPQSFALLALWSALSLFLGVFVGLIVQGQSVTRS